MDKDVDRLSRDFKQTFGTEYGKRVLESLKKFGKGNVEQSVFCEENQHQTSYNLGANAVYRYIQHQIDMELDEPKTEDCITEPEPEQKGI